VRRGGGGGGMCGGGSGRGWGERGVVFCVCVCCVCVCVCVCVCAGAGKTAKRRMHTMDLETHYYWVQPLYTLPHLPAEVSFQSHALGPGGNPGLQPSCVPRHSLHALCDLLPHPVKSYDSQKRTFRRCEDHVINRELHPSHYGAKFESPL